VFRRLRSAIAAPMSLSSRTTTDMIWIPLAYGAHSPLVSDPVARCPTLAAAKVRHHSTARTASARFVREGARSAVVVSAFGVEFEGGAGAECRWFVLIASTVSAADVGGITR